MNPRTIFVGLGSAVIAAGLTYWAISPGRDVKMARLTPGTPAAVGAPFVISTAGPDSAPVVVRVAKPSPTMDRVIPVPTKTPEPVVALPQPVEQPVAVVVSVPAEPVVAAPPAPPGAIAPPPPVRVPLNPPKEIDRAAAEPVVMRERVSGGPNTVTINQGTFITVRIGETLTVQKNLSGDSFFATLAVPLVADGFVIAEKGARVEGRIVEVDKAGRMSGTSRMSLELTQVNTSDGQRVRLQTSTFTKDGAERNRKNDAAKIGGGAILGAIIGAAAGGGKGAGVGAGAGGAAGAGAVLLSGSRNLSIPVETKLIFRVEKPVIITERVVQ